MKPFRTALPLLSFFALIFIPCCNPVQDPAFPGSDITIVSRQGATRVGPENTFASAGFAVENKAGYIGIDIRRSLDGVHYILHDSTVDRTTNGTGLISQKKSDYIESLDAGSWFSHEFTGEPVPRLREFLLWLKGRAGVYMNILDGDIKEIRDMVYELGFENDCFFGFPDEKMIRDFRNADNKLALKLTVPSLPLPDALIREFGPAIIEHDIVTLTDEFIQACHERGLRVMASVRGVDPAGYRKAISMNVDMVNLDSPDIFSNMVRNNGIFKGYRLIAHRGGITGGIHGEYNEFDPASIQKAIDLGYYMIEVDVRKTSDGVLIVHHDNDFRRFFNDPRRVDETSWEEVRKLRSDRGNYHPLSFEEVARMCSGKVRMMVDTKVPRTPEFIEELGEIMEKYDLLDGAYFLGSDIEPFMGKAKMSINMGQLPRLMQMIENGEDVARHFFLFSGANLMTSSAVKLAQQNYITVVAAVNIHNYRLENHWHGAKRDIEFLKECGVTVFQIDSHYDQWLPFY
jgi:glycerophosphoryl diester phosphodiesterase